MVGNTGMDEREIFERSLDFADAGERQAYLAEACGNDRVASWTGGGSSLLS